MKKKYCPHCGHLLRPGTQFCGNCGFDLTGGNSPQSIPSNRRPVKHKKSRWIIVVILIVIMVGSFGAFYVHQHSRSSQRSKSTQVSRPIRQRSVHKKVAAKETPVKYKPVTIFWQRVNNATRSKFSDGSNSNLSDLFVDSSHNGSCVSMQQWLNQDVKPGIHKGIKVTSFKPYDFSSHGSTLRYKVRSDFNVHNRHHHIQIFNWTAQAKSGKIISMKSNKSGAKDYDE